MDEKEKDNESEFALHKSVFDNDLKKLTQILKVTKNKEAIDKKVKKIEFSIFALKMRSQLIYELIIDRISMAILLCTWPRLSGVWVR
jgi:hypothetical protein